MRSIVAPTEEVYKAIPKPGMGWISIGQLAKQFRVSEHTITKRLFELESMIEMQKLNGAKCFQKKKGIL